MQDPGQNRYSATTTLPVQRLRRTWRYYAGLMGAMETPTDGIKRTPFEDIWTPLPDDLDRLTLYEFRITHARTSA